MCLHAISKDNWALSNSECSLHGLTEEACGRILSIFPLVPDPVKVAARHAYRDVERRLMK